MRLCNDAACKDLQLSEKEVIGANINNLLKGFNFTRWLESKEVLGQTTRVEVAGEDFIADILQIAVPQGNEGDVLAGAVINIKSQSRLGQQVSAFRRYGQAIHYRCSGFSTVLLAQFYSTMYLGLNLPCKTRQQLRIGGADGPTAIFLASKLAPDLLGAIAVAAYSYMALVPILQPPIMRALTTPEERKIQMPQLRTVSKKEKIIFPLMVLTLTMLYPQRHR